MNREQLAELNAFQVAGLTLLASTLVAVGMFFLFRRRGGSGQETAEEIRQANMAPVQPAISTVAPAEIPHHFSEDLLVPGITETGTEVAEQDRTEGRSPEGV